MTIQEHRDNIFHNYGTDVDTLDSSKLRGLANELDYLADELEVQEATVNTMKHDVARTLSELANKYKNKFDPIYLFGGDISTIEDDDIEFDSVE